MKINIEIERSLLVDLPVKQVRMLIDEVEPTLGRFPKLKKLTRLGPDQYLSELKAIGSSIANIAHEVSYGARYRRSADGLALNWDAIPGQGNASISGSLSVAEKKTGSEIRFKVKGELRDVPVPLMYRLAAAPFIQGKFAHLIDIYLELTRDALLEPAAPAAKKKATR